MQYLRNSVFSAARKGESNRVRIAPRLRCGGPHVEVWVAAERYPRSSRRFGRRIAADRRESVGTSAQIHVIPEHMSARGPRWCRRVIGQGELGKEVRVRMSQVERDGARRVISGDA